MSETFQSISKGGFEQQRSRLPPAAETGRRGWGSAPIFQGPAKGLQKNRQAQLVRPAALRPGGKKAPAGPFSMRGLRNPPAPTKNSSVVMTLEFLSYVDFSGCVLFRGAPCFFTMLHHFLRAASGIRHQHGSGSDAAHPGIVPIFCAGMPYKHARKQCHFPAYCPILSA